MSAIRPGLLLLLCTCFVSLAVPGAMATWLRATDSFIGGMTAVGSSGDQPREIASGWLFLIVGVLAALVYAIPAGVAFVVLRRFGNRARNVTTILILPFALVFVWLRLTGRA